MKPTLEFSLSDFYVTRCRAYRYGNCCKARHGGVQGRPNSSSRHAYKISQNAQNRLLLAHIKPRPPLPNGSELPTKRKYLRPYTFQPYQAPAITAPNMRPIWGSEWETGSSLCRTPWGEVCRVGLQRFSPSEKSGGLDGPISGQSGQMWVRTAK